MARRRRIWVWILAQLPLLLTTGVLLCASACGQHPSHQPQPTMVCPSGVTRTVTGTSARDSGDHNSPSKHAVNVGSARSVCSVTTKMGADLGAEMSGAQCCYKVTTSFVDVTADEPGNTTSGKTHVTKQVSWNGDDAEKCVAAGQPAPALNGLAVVGYGFFKETAGDASISCCDKSPNLACGCGVKCNSSFGAGLVGAQGVRVKFGDVCNSDEGTVSGIGFAQMDTTSCP